MNDFKCHTSIQCGSEAHTGRCAASGLRIASSTNDNGDQLFVNGDLRSNGLDLKTHTGKETLEGCVRTFAYWEPELLTSKKLLNVQTGEHVPVDIESLGVSTINVRGIAVEANHYRLNNEKFSIDLWYSQNQEWLALESTTESGARLRYLVK